MNDLYCVIYTNENGVSSTETYGRMPKIEVRRAVKGLQRRRYLDIVVYRIEDVLPNKYVNVTSEFVK